MKCLSILLFVLVLTLAGCGHQAMRRKVENLKTASKLSGSTVIMMNSRKIIFGFPISLMMLAILSCARKSHDAGSAGIVVKVDVSSAGMFDIDVDASLEKLVPLETTGSSLIGSLDKVLFADDRIVVLDKKNKRILLFSGTGAFLRPIGRQGNGPGEYVEVSDLCYDKSRKILCAFDRLKQKMILYPLDGEDINTIQARFTCNSFLPVQDGWWFYYSYKNNPDRWSLLHVDPEMKRAVEGFFPYKDFLPATMKPCFASGGGRDLFFYNYSNYIYELADGKPKPYIEVDFGDRSLSYDRILKAATPQEFSAVMTESKGLGDIQNVHSSERYLYLEFSEVGFNTFSFSYFGIIDTKEPGITIFNSFNNSEILRDYTLTGVTEEDELVYALYPSRYGDNYPEKIKAASPGISYDDNPILAYFKLKSHGHHY